MVCQVFFIMSYGSWALFFFGQELIRVAVDNEENFIIWWCGMMTFENRSAKETT